MTEQMPMNRHFSDQYITYDLTPMQQGMLLHCISAPHSGVDVEQVIGTLQEALALASFKRAWQRLVDRHEALRMRFLLDEKGVARQCPLDEVTLLFGEHDWSNLSSQERDRLLQEFLQEDRLLGFDPRVDLPIRVAIFRFGESDYRFVWTWWHGILDGRARLLLLKELFRYYDAFCRGEELDLPLPRRYADYTAWLAARDSTAAVAYWRKLLEGFTEPTPLGIDRPVTAAAGKGFGVHEIRLSEAVSSQLEIAAKEYGVTMNTLVQAAWALVLGQHGGQDDVLFGNTRACRYSAFGGDGSGHEIVGALINTVPVRVKICPEMRVRDWLADLRAQHVAVRPFEHFSLAAIQQCSGVRADRRLFDSIVVYENRLLDSDLRSEGQGWGCRQFEIRGCSGYPLLVYGYGEAELLLGIENDRARIDDATAQRMLRHLATAIQALAAHPGAAVGDLSLLPEEEVRMLLEGWNHTQCPFPEDASIQSCFEDQVARAPNAPALSFRGRSWTYRELGNRAEWIAQQLRKAGAGPETIVGICMERSLDLVAGLLGILKAGAAYLPLDPAYPTERLAFMVADASPHLVVSSRSDSSRLAGIDVAMLLVDELSAASVTDELPGPLQHAAVGGSSAAYVIYTSGSTGKPKGVLVEHRNVLNLFAGMDAVLGREPGVCLAVTSVSFDPSVLDLFWTLTRGYHVVLWPGLQDAGDASIPDLIGTYGVTNIFTVPSFLRLVMMLPGGAQALGSLRRIVVGGEPLSSTLLGELGPSISRRIVNAYGPTETTVISTTWSVLPEAESIPIGRPIANTKLFVLDAHRRLVPIGVAGELHIGGAGVARGYLNRPELTAERFIVSPFVQSGGERLYRTGDLVRYQPDGMVEFLGRQDGQVKIRGFRVELGEIEAVLARHPDVQEIAIDVQETESSGKQMVAYTVPRSSTAPSSKELRDWVARDLPEYMVPTAFVVLQTIPRTSNGKLDREALPKPISDGGISRGAQAPKTTLETTVGEIWCEVLGLTEVGLDDNFFDLGGNSLLLARVLVTLQDKVAQTIPIVTLFQYPTIRSLSSHLSREEASKPTFQKAHDRAQLRNRAMIGRAQRPGRTNH